MSYDPGMRFGRGIATGVTGAALAVVGAHASACGKFDATSDTPADAVAPPGDAPNGEMTEGGGADGATTDAGTNADASDADSGCGHLFCADFEGTTAGQEWSVLHESSGASAAIAGGAGMPGSALRSSIPADANTNMPSDYAYVVKAFPGEHGLHVELEMMVPSTPLADSSTVLTILQISGQGPSNEAGVGVTLRSTSPRLGFYFSDGSGSGMPVATLVDLPRDRWTAVALDVRFGPGGTVALTVDKMGVYAANFATATPAVPEVRVGVQHYNGPTSAFSALFDTVRVDALK